MGTLLVGFILGCPVTIESGQAQSKTNDPDTAVNGSGISHKPSKPMIIWYSRRWGWGLHEPLRLVTSSGFFSHVMLMGLHKYDIPTYAANPKYLKAFNLCKKNDVKVIWARPLYPNHKLRRFTVQDAFDAEYYVQQIREVRKEARKMKVDLVAFDAEMCCDCPLVPFKHRNLSEAEFGRLKRAISTAIQVAGKVDFILPARTSLGRHIYDATSSLGKLIITEHTYYDIPWTHSKEMEKKRPYDIFGAYVGLTKKNKDHPNLPLFTPREILERQYLWIHKKGLFIYPGGDPGGVALEFSRIRNIRPSLEKRDGD